MHSAAHPTERDSLLVPYNDPCDGKRRNLGPLEVSTSTRRGILSGIWLGAFLSALNRKAVLFLLVCEMKTNLLKCLRNIGPNDSISSEFKKSSQASWLGTSYLLAICTFTPLYGRLCNVLGRQGASQLALFFAGSGILLCGLSDSMEMLIIARFLSGIGGGGLFTISSIVVSDMYTMRERGLAQGIASVFNGLGLGLGGPIGGVVTDLLGWRWAFLLQLPFFFISFGLTTYHLQYVTPGRGKTALEVFKRIDYGGIITLLIAVGSTLVFLSVRYNEGLPWSTPIVVGSFLLGIIFFVLFLLVELFVSPEPVLAPSLLRQKVPLLVGTSNVLVAMCNFAIMYFLPMYFQTVMLTSASIAGLHLLPNSIAMSVGSVFAGWIMHYTGRYKSLNLFFGVFPFIGASLIASLREQSGPLKSWLSIVPLGFGNAVILQTMLIALLAHLPDSQIAVGTGFGQVFRGLGQVGGVAISSAVFQSKLEQELHNRIHTPDAEDLIQRIRQSSRLIRELPFPTQRAARDAYATSIHLVFTLAACSTLLAYLVRLPIPDKQLDTNDNQQENSSKRFSDEENNNQTERLPNIEHQSGTTRTRQTVQLKGKHLLGYGSYGGTDQEHSRKDGSA
ncbi:hypothetical protein AMATHDRAFT_1185 [Amanita thiersii Skay4041]|uniref:Major facilitator superfamily (MFS) profile domain-containing protein n=1 Tax=Amanita thiersii Skay4041 TaxID=703135 RepID=A0A2A9NYD2_9AGAR|nr:hypothetical protein AMATHDRAFT_1185 [Amanita thiersii Skay4041]